VSLPAPLVRPLGGGAGPVPVYINAVTYGAQAEAVANHMVKGRRVAVTGRLEYREWATADKVRHSIHEVVASQIDFLDAPPANGEPTYGPARQRGLTAGNASCQGCGAETPVSPGPAVILAESSSVLGRFSASAGARVRGGPVVPGAASYPPPEPSRLHPVPPLSRFRTVVEAVVDGRGSLVVSSGTGPIVLV
jgi:single-stranded DNA-binding protein